MLPANRMYIGLQGMCFKLIVVRPLLFPIVSVAKFFMFFANQ